MKVRRTTPYFYVLPGLLLVFMIVYVPVFSNLIYSFFRLSSYSKEMSFVGLKNYVALFTDPVLLIIIKNNILYVVVSLVVQVGFGTFLAILLESGLSGKANGVYRNVLFTPALMSLTAVGLLWQFIYTPKIGLLNSLLRFLGLESLQHVWLGESGLAMLSIIGMSQWQFTGYITILMVVAIQKIPEEYFEASRMAGCQCIPEGYLYHFTFSEGAASCMFDYNDGSEHSRSLLKCTSRQVEGRVIRLTSWEPISINRPFYTMTWEWQLLWG